LASAAFGATARPWGVVFLYVAYRFFDWRDDLGVVEDVSSPDEPLTEHEAAGDMPYQPWNRLYVDTDPHNRRGTVVLLVRVSDTPGQWAVVNAAGRVQVMDLRVRGRFTARARAGWTYDPCPAVTADEKRNIEDQAVRVLRRRGLIGAFGGALGLGGGGGRARRGRRGMLGGLGTVFSGAFTVLRAPFGAARASARWVPSVSSGGVCGACFGLVTTSPRHTVG